MNKVAIYPLSGDPVHKGHIHNLAVAVNSGLFDKVYFALGNNPAKKYLFSVKERLALAEKAILSAGLDSSKVVVESFSGLLRNYALVRGAEFVVRGARNAGDFDYEMVLSDFNSQYGLQTFILPATEENRGVSSSIVKSIVTEGGMVDRYVHPAVKQALEEKLRGVSLIGVTGNMGVGKSTFCQQIVKSLQETYGVEASHIDFDKLVHAQYSGNDPINAEVKRKIKDSFGEGIFEGEQLDRKKLAGIVFGSKEKRDKLTEILRIPALVGFENAFYNSKGFAFVDAAYLTEYNMLPLVNYNVILVGCDEQERLSRVFKRDGMTRAEVEAKTSAQHSPAEKREIIQAKQAAMHHGYFLEVDTTKGVNYAAIAKSIVEYFSISKTLGGRKDVCSNS